MSAAETPRAFPSAAIDDSYGGMSLRDWFAGQAMPQVLATAYVVGTANGQIDARIIAQGAYLMADAMMAVREREKLPTECPQSPSGRHEVDTSMGSGPSNCFYCESKMP